VIAGVPAVILDRCALQLKESAGRQDPKLIERIERQEVRVAGDDAVGFTVDRRLKEFVIVGSRQTWIFPVMGTQSTTLARSDRNRCRSV
jgi:hypothetical protein